MSVVLICGRMKEGKTTLALRLATEHTRGVVVWDPRHMIDGGTYVSDPSELENAIAENDWERGPIVVRPDGLNLRGDFADCAQVLWMFSERNAAWAFVVDEAADLQSSHAIDMQLMRLVKQHPRGCMIVQTTHSLQEWHRASRDVVNELYCFRLIGNSLKAVVDFCDGDLAFSDTITKLPRHWYVRYNFEAPAGDSAWEVFGADGKMVEQEKADAVNRA